MQLNVKNYIEKETERLREVVSQMEVKPKLVLVKASDDNASDTYINNKVKQCQKIGIESEVVRFDETTTNDKMVSFISELNNDEIVTGVLIQVPLFKHLDEDLILNSLSSEKDVDGFTNVNQGKLLNGCRDLVACTPKGIVDFLKNEDVLFPGMNTVIVNRSRIVGKPISQILLKRGATVTICHSKTKDISIFTKQADILVAAVGRPHIITKDMVKEGAVVVDVGINRVNGKILGDVDTESVLPICSKITPVPGGVGLTTVLSLLENVVQATIEQNKEGN